jgi:DNA-binding NarL/FixJ family response regulator
MENLTPREQEIVERLGNWESVKGIAAALQIDRKTVYCHVSNVAERLPDEGPPLRRVQHWAASRKRGG